MAVFSISTGFVGDEVRDNIAVDLTQPLVRKLVYNDRSYRLLAAVANFKTPGTYTTSATGVVNFHYGPHEDPIAQVSDGDTITVNGTVYTFKTALTSGNANAGEVLIGVTGVTDALTNFAAAINHTGTPGTDYDSSTVINPNVSANADTLNSKVTLTAKTGGTVGNSITLAAAASSPSIILSGITAGHLIGGSAEQLKIVLGYAVDGQAASAGTSVTAVNGEIVLSGAADTNAKLTVKDSPGGSMPAGSWLCIQSYSGTDALASLVGLNLSIARVLG